MQLTKEQLSVVAGNGISGISGISDNSNFKRKPEISLIKVLDNMPNMPNMPQSKSKNEAKPEEPIPENTIVKASANARTEGLPPEPRLPRLTQAPNETDENFLNRRRMTAGLSHDPYIDPYPIDGGDYWIYPAWKVKKNRGSID